MAGIDPSLSLSRLSTSIAKLSARAAQFSEDVYEAQNDMNDLSEKLESLETCIETLQTDFDATFVPYSERQKKHLKIMLDNSDQITKKMAGLLTSLNTDGKCTDTLWEAAPRELMASLQQALEEDKSAIALIIGKKQTAAAESGHRSQNQDLTLDSASMMSDTGTLPPVPYAREDPSARPGEVPDQVAAWPRQPVSRPTAGSMGRVSTNPQNHRRSGSTTNAHAISASPTQIRQLWHQDDNSRQITTLVPARFSQQESHSANSEHVGRENHAIPHEALLTRMPDDWTGRQLIPDDRPFEQRPEGDSDKQVVPSNFSVRSGHTLASVSEASTRGSIYYQFEKGNLNEIAITAATKTRNRLSDSDRDKKDKELLKRVREGAELSKIESLLDGGADPNAAGPKNTALTTEIQYHGRQQVMELLLQRGAEPNATSDGIPDYKIIKSGDTDKWRSSFGIGSYVDAVPFRVGILYLAALYTNLNVVKLLISYGASLRPHADALSSSQTTVSPAKKGTKRPAVDRKDSSGTRAGGHGSVILAAAENDKWDMVQLLAIHGADPNQTGGKYWSVLQLATAKNQTDIMKLLISRGADVNAQGGLFGCALVAAAYESHPTAAKILLDAGANIDMQSRKFGTALNAAVLNGYLNVVKLLLESGADVKFGYPLDTAIQRSKDDPENKNKTAIVRALEARGARQGPADKKVPEWAGLFSDTY